MIEIANVKISYDRFDKCYILGILERNTKESKALILDKKGNKKRNELEDDIIFFLSSFSNIYIYCNVRKTTSIISWKRGKGCLPRFISLQKFMIVGKLSLAENCSQEILFPQSINRRVDCGARSFVSIGPTVMDADLNSSTWNTYVVVSGRNRKLFESWPNKCSEFGKQDKKKKKKKKRKEEGERRGWA